MKKMNEMTKKTIIGVVALSLILTVGIVKAAPEDAAP